MSDGHQSLIHETLCRVHLRENFDTLTTARNVAVMNRVAGSFCWDPHAHTRPQLLDDDDIVLKMASVRSRISGWRVHRSICRCPATATLGSGSKKQMDQSLSRRQMLPVLGPRLLRICSICYWQDTASAAVAVSIFGVGQSPARAADIKCNRRIFADPQNVIGVASELAD